MFPRERQVSAFTESGHYDAKVSKSGPDVCPTRNNRGTRDCDPTL